MPAAYLIVEMKVSIRSDTRNTWRRQFATIAAAGGEYLVRGGKSEKLEGDRQPVRLAVLKFPSYEHAKAWYDGENYRNVRRKRAGATEFFNMVLVEGMPTG